MDQTSIQYVAVPVRNRTLFIYASIFRPHYRIQSGVVQNFRSGWGSYTVCRLIRYSCTLAVCMSPALNESFVPQCFERGNAVELRNGIMFDFYSGLPHMLYRKCLLESPNRLLLPVQYNYIDCWLPTHHATIKSYVHYSSLLLASAEVDVNHNLLCV